MKLIPPIAAVLCFFGGAAACLILIMAAKRKAARRGRRAQKKGMGAMDRILIVLGAFLFCFIVAMVVVFIKKDGIPDTLVQCVFGACGLEGGIMGWIKTTKERGRERRWARKDERGMEETEG